MNANRCRFGGLPKQVRPYTSAALAILSTLLAWTSARAADGDAEPMTPEVWTWGGNMYAELGHSPGLPLWPPGGRHPARLVPGVTQPVDIAAGYFHTIVLDASGHLWTWGSNDNGELGRGSESISESPGRVPALENAYAIAGGQYFSAAVLSDGTVWTWGANSRGQLGDGTTVDRSRPVRVGGIDNVTAIAAGRNFVIALKRDGTVWGWGYNGYGQLGDGTKTDRRNPMPMVNVDRVKAIACCDSSTIVLLEDGTVRQCGFRGFVINHGKDTTFAQVTPIQVDGLRNISSIACGHNHRLAIKNDGTVWAWGYGMRGQLGVGEVNSGGRKGSGPNLTDAAQVPGLPAIETVAAGMRHSLAVDKMGMLWAWGTNQNGQFGNRILGVSLVPTKIVELSGIEKIASGVNHVVAIKRGGVVMP